MTNRQDKIRGLLIGTAVGDALGLPAEGFNPQTIRKLGWSDWKHRFIFGKGMVSDDTEHTIFVAQSLLSHPDDHDAFKKSLAWKLRWWLLAIPAGIGFGTLRAILKLWFFVPLKKSGVFSAGNGPAMRSAVIGARFADDIEKMRRFVKCSTELTHKDPRAYVGALAVSYAAAFAINNPQGKELDKKLLLDQLLSLGGEQDKEWSKAIGLINQGLDKNLSVADFADSMGLHKGVTGYVYHTVPVAIYAWLYCRGDFKRTLTEVLSCGGDTDTVGAVAGALAGAAAGEKAIPPEWIENIFDWPRSISVLRKIADAVAANDNSRSEPVRYFWPGVILRNILFLMIVLGHVLLRLIPTRIRSLVKV